MRTPTDNPVDPLGGLGAPVRDPAPAPAAPAPAKGFELGNWAATLPEGLAEKPAEPAPAPEPAALHCRACGGQAQLCNGVAVCRRLDCRG